MRVMPNSVRDCSWSASHFAHQRIDILSTDVSGQARATHRLRCVMKTCDGLASGTLTMSSNLRYSALCDPDVNTKPLNEFDELLELRIRMGPSALTQALRVKRHNVRLERLRRHAVGSSM